MRFSREKACRILASPRTLAAVLVLAFVLRAAWGVAAGDAQRFWDSDSYITIADNYLAGEPNSDDVTLLLMRRKQDG